MNANVKIRARSRTIFDGYKGMMHNGQNYQLAVGPHGCVAPNGDLLVTFLTGSKTEPAPDNCMAMMRSSDNGHTWSEPEMFIPSHNDDNSQITSINVVDGKLIADGAYWPYKEAYLHRKKFLIESTDNGYTWSKPRFYEAVLPSGEDFNPQWRWYSDRYGCTLAGCYYNRKRSVPLNGNIMDLRNAATEEEALAISANAAEKSNCQEFLLTHHLGCGVARLSQDYSNVEWLGGVENRPLGLIEPTCIELTDGRLVMYMRAELDGFLWRTESSDGGHTWKEAWRTDIQNPSTQPYLYRLRDGRILLAHNVCGKPGVQDIRNTLSVWISDDELNSFSIKEDILYESGSSLSYPFVMETNDGRILLFYDKTAWARYTVEMVELNIP